MSVFTFRKHRKLYGALLSLGLLLVIARAVAPAIILRKINAYLADFSPMYALHIGDLKLHIYRMAYSLENLEGNLKNKPDKDHGKFLDVQKVDIALAWRELLRGKIVTDVRVETVNFKVTTSSINALSGKGEQVKKDAKNVKDAAVPFDLESVHVRNSTFIFSDMAGLSPQEDFRATHVEILANNLTPSNHDGLAVFTATADVQGDSKVKAVGEMRPNHTPLDWSVNVEMKDFVLAKLNPIARRMVPVTFKSGTLSLYSAARSVDGKVLGYVKPFLKDVVFIGDKGDFKNVGQFFVEIAGSLGNWLLKNGKNHSLATKVAFKTGPDGKMDVDTGKAIKVAMDNGFGQQLPQKIDEPLSLN